jgi:hypothetical protein
MIYMGISILFLNSVAMMSSIAIFVIAGSHRCLQHSLGKCDERTWKFSIPWYG